MSHGAAWTVQPRAGELGPGRLELGGVAPGDGDLRAELAERARDGEADAAAAAGDDGDVSVEETGPEDAGHGVTLAHASRGLRSPIASTNASDHPARRDGVRRPAPMLP